MDLFCPLRRCDLNTAESANEADSALHHHSAVAVNQYFCDRRIEGNIRSSNPESMLPSISPYIAAPLMHVHCGGVRNPRKMTQGQAEADSAIQKNDRAACAHRETDG